MTRSTNRTIAINTIAIYTRTILGACLSLFSSRWILNGLGATDWGLFAVVGGVVGFLSFITGAMSTSVQRHLAYSIGSGNTQAVCKVFNVAVFLHAVGALLLIVLGEGCGIWVVGHVLNIPADRVWAAQVVYQCVLFSSAAGVLAVPFLGLFAARQRLLTLCVYELLPVIFFFVLAYCLRFVSQDRLIFYAVCSTSIGVAFLAVQMGLAFRLFQECRIHIPFMRDPALMKELLHFAGWNFFGIAGSVCSRQGVTILLNVYFGPSINAAYGIADQVNNQTSLFAVGFLKSAGPEVATREGRGERERMLSLAVFATKIATFLTLFWMIPLAAEIGTVLKLWLRNVPEYTDIFCLLIFIAVLFDNLSVGYPMVVQAVGRIAGYQVTVGLWIMMVLPLAVVTLMFVRKPTAVLLIAAVVTAVQMAIRIGWVWYLVKMSPMRWVREVVWPTVKAFVVSAGAAMALHQCLAPTLGRLFLTVTLSVGLSALGVVMFGLVSDERVWLRKQVIRIWSRIRAVPEPIPL